MVAVAVAAAMVVVAMVVVVDDDDMGGLPGSWVTNRWGKPEWRGAKRAEDAWKWQGVPAGFALTGPVEPGRDRACMGPDARGLPHLKSLPPAWPPGQSPDEGSGTGSA